jgi:tripartite-type tricarboxylate transporter receptor subunit TctC
MGVLKRISSILLTCLMAGQALAQAYPTNPIKVVVGYAAGGAVDVVARTIVQSLSFSMGQTVVVENKPGAGSNIAETGFSGFEASLWYGLVAPVARPKPLVNKLHDEVQKAKDVSNASVMQSWCAKPTINLIDT